MKNLLFITLTILAFTVGNGCSAQVIGSQGEDKVRVETKGDLKIYRNIRYASRPDSFETDTSSDRLLDLYRPQSAEGKLPVIVFIHGGGFSGGDKKGTEAICAKLSALGYAVLSINYRLESKRKKVSGGSAGANTAKGLPANGRFQEPFRKAISSASEDTQLALKWIKENASEYKLNSSSVALAGGSAGGMTALHTAYVSDQKVLPVKAVVNLWGALENAEIIKKGAPPVLTFHGDKDVLVHIDYAYAIKKQMEKTGNTLSQLHIMPGKGHARYDIVANEKTAEIDAFLKKAFK
ncbi:MAG TPA: alpha/beta hydrolase [Sphingobacteriaceae bacterium]